MMGWCRDKFALQGGRLWTVVVGIVFGLYLNDRIGMCVDEEVSFIGMDGEFVCCEIDSLDHYLQCNQFHHPKFERIPPGDDQVPDRRSHNFSPVIL